jgi:hypothetical protein
MTKIEKAEPLTVERLRVVLPNADEAFLAALAADANLDPDENVDWLPYYKADCCGLMGVIGGLGALCDMLIERVDHPKKDTFKAELRKLLGEAGDIIALGGVGPSTDPEVIRRSQEVRRGFVATILQRTG